ncbi:hypothetical protein OJF2_34150 [Aquisphaera giovannonii]|uniref:Secreted protein n=1 Tax=Aquisphaera giovannonii TaxID=406548 RepID=A0A5B9W4F2_9BACT|nr:hypothetical protein [Aquisphaera giovannonii]QEH34870.1 hypothetical protein OJF2_34150 [Aquisphaera giovannonii]
MHMSRRPSALAWPLALSVAIAAPLAVAGCGDSSSGKTVKVSPEFQKKTEDYLINYGNQMKAQHQTKGKAKGR